MSTRVPNSWLKSVPFERLVTTLDAGEEFGEVVVGGGTDGAAALDEAEEEAGGVAAGFNMSDAPLTYLASVVLKPQAVAVRDSILMLRCIFLLRGFQRP